MVPVILSGGAGTRLWPLSRESHPKQFLPLTGGAAGDTLLQATWLRVAALASAAPIAVANAEHRFMVAEQLRQAGCSPQAIVLEPVARNTAPAIALAALQAMGSGDDPLLLVLPSDHRIADAEGFRAAALRAAPAAAAGKLVTFGVVPTGPETGYGYIKAAGAAANDAPAWRPVERFLEKPDAATAEAFVASGDHLWNSGMFLFRASVFLDELGQHRPDILAACRAAMAGAARDADFVRVDAAAFTACPSDSIDYAVMEKTRHAVVLPIDVGWDDVGSWAALWKIAGHDGEGNALHGDVLAQDTRDTLGWAADGRLMALLGVQDLVVVDTADAVLVAHRDRVQEVKAIVSQLKAGGRSEPVTHRRVYRPWGSYEQVDGGDRFQVKRIVVKPGASLSLQMHHHRAEHWIVVRGTGRVTRGDEVLLLSENESTFIPLGVKHRLENPGRVPLEMIEVQSGAYLGEDDIVRFEDTYGRA